MIKKSKKYILNNARNLYDGSELVINPFKSGLFPLKPTTGTRLLTPKKCFKDCQ